MQTPNPIKQTVNYVCLLLLKPAVNIISKVCMNVWMNMKLC